MTETHTCWLADFLSRLGPDTPQRAGRVNLESLDRPGWRLWVDLTDTPLHGAAFEPVSARRAEDDWIEARLRLSGFAAECGPVNLEDMLALFRDWAEARLPDTVAEQHDVWADKDA